MSCPPFLLSHRDRGLWAEARVWEFKKDFGYRLLFHRTKIWKTELDLVFRKSNRLLIVEVKTESFEGFINHRFSAHQKNRIKRVIEFLRHNTDLEVEFEFVEVACSGNCTVYEDVL